MKRYTTSIYVKCTTQLLTLLLISTLFGCATKDDSSSKEFNTIKSIVVLPVDTINHSSNNENISSQNNPLIIGRDVLETTIGQYFSGKHNLKFVSQEQEEALLTSYNLDKNRQALAICEKLNGDAVLTTQINRYLQREGKEYSVGHPASVSFEYRLMLTGTGQTLCAGVYDETQKSWTDNILSFKKAFSRGGKWITAEQLTKEGVSEKFGSCRYLKK